MPRNPCWPPRVYPHGGKDYLRLYLGPRKYKEYPLGPSGSPEATREYLRLVAELEANGRQALPAQKSGLLVLELIAPYLSLARDRYATPNYHRIKTALEPLADLYGHTPAREFTPLRLEAVRERYVQAGYCRNSCNARTSIVRRLFRWGVVRHGLEVSVAQALSMLEPLKKRRTSAPDYPRVPPAPAADIEKTIACLPPIVADMVRVQLLTGMRPGELCALTPGAINVNWRREEGTTLWLYALDEHKTDWQGRDHAYAIGPRAQAVLAPYMKRHPERACFSPYEVRVAYNRARGMKINFGKTRYPGTNYTTGSYGRCIRQACRRAGVPEWSPNQLRHAAGTAIQTEFDRDAARCVLGHATGDVTGVYAMDLEKAAKVIARMG